MTDTPRTASELLALNVEQQDQESQSLVISKELNEAFNKVNSCDLSVVESAQLCELIFLDCFNRIEADLGAMFENNPEPVACYQMGRLLGLLATTGRDIQATASEIAGIVPDPEGGDTEERAM